MQNLFSKRFRSVRPRGSCSGFTLLELIAVIGIIAIMSLVVLGGFNGIGRALARESGESTLRRALNLARQQACVDGQDVYVWVTGVNSFAVVRKAGTVTDRKTSASLSFDYAGGKKSISDLGNGNALWVYDAYADLGAAGLGISFDDETWDDVSVHAVLDNYKGLLIFDMEDGTMANVVVAPMFNTAADAWVFGVNKDEAGSSFSEGHDYGWLVMPQQSLPKGYVFEGSYKEDGSWKTGYKKNVRFLADGTVDGGGTTFEILETATGTTRRVEVSGEGKIQ